jgi:hypothetical protein
MEPRSRFLLIPRYYPATFILLSLVPQPQARPANNCIIQSFFPDGYCAVRENATFPVDAPPMQVDVKSPVGHTARAALTHPSHLPLLTLIVAPASTALSLNNAVPDDPVVDVGEPPHFVMAPAMPPHIPSSATF